MFPAREPHSAMAFRDTWHRALVYFGLAEDHDEYLEEVPAGPSEADLEDRYRERPNIRRLSSRRRRDEIDDIFADDEPAPRSGSRTRVLRPVDNGGRGTG